MPLDALDLNVGPAGAKRPVYSSLPAELITGTGAQPKPRLRVDPGQTGFFEGRQFRTYHEMNIATASTLWGRFVTPVDVIIVKRELIVVQGNLRFALSNAGTPGGSWTAKTVYPLNTMSERPTPLYASQVAPAIGGTVTSPTEIDVVLLETGTSQAVSVSNTADEVGFAAGTYYVELRNTGANTLRGIYQVIWEERQPAASSIIY